MQDTLKVRKVKKESDYERMLRALDQCGDEYFRRFGISRESWQDWRAGGKGTPSTGTLKWRFPRIVELKYPDIIKSTEDWDNWVKGVNLDRRISDRTRRVLTMLALFYNLRTGQCNPAMHHLAMMAGLGEDEAAEVMARTAIASGERAGWVKRVYRRGGRKHNQSNEYKLLTPEAVRPRPNILEQNRGADRTNSGGRPNSRVPQQQGIVGTGNSITGTPYTSYKAAPPSLATLASRDAANLETYKRKKEEFEEASQTSP